MFQPHLLSRTREFADEYGWALSRAYIVMVAPIYPSRERQEEFPEVDSELVATAVRKAGGRQVHCPQDHQELYDRLMVLARDEQPGGTMLLFMGAGDITSLASRVAGTCQQECSGEERP